MVLTKIGNQVKSEVSLFLKFETKTSYCPLTDLGIKNQFFSQCEGLDLAPRVLKGNLKKASLWSNGSAGGAEFEFISSNQIANYQSFVEKTGLSSTSRFIKANLKLFNILIYCLLPLGILSIAYSYQIFPFWPQVFPLKRIPYLILYTVMAIYIIDLVSEIHWLLDLVFYITFGFLWILPSIPFVNWLARKEN